MSQPSRSSWPAPPLTETREPRADVQSAHDHPRPPLRLDARLPRRRGPRRRRLLDVGRVRAVGARRDVPLHRRLALHEIPARDGRDGAEDFPGADGDGLFHGRVRNRGRDRAARTTNTRHRRFLYHADACRYFLGERESRTGAPARRGKAGDGAMAAFAGATTVYRPDVVGEPHLKSYGAGAAVWESRALIDRAS